MNNLIFQLAVVGDSIVQGLNSLEVINMSQSFQTVTEIIVISSEDTPFMHYVSTY